MRMEINKHEYKWTGGRGESVRLLKRCLVYFAPYKSQLVLAVASMVLVAAATGAAAFLVKPALDDIFISKDGEALYLLPPLFVLVILAKGAGRYCQNYFMQYCGLKVLEALRTELYVKIIHLPVRFFEDSQIGMLTSRIINDVMMIRTSLPSIVMLIRQVLTMAALMAVVFYQDWFLAIFAFLVLPLAIYPFIYFGKKLRNLGRKNQSKLADIASVLTEVLSGIRVVKAFAAEDKEAQRFDVENDRLVRIALRQVVMNEFSSPIMELIGALGMGLVIFYGGMQVIEGSSTPGTFFSFLTALIMMYDPIKKLNSANLDIQRALAGAERVFQLLDDPDIREEEEGGEVFDGEFQELVFENVTFRYQGTETPALKDISFTLSAGERIAVVGPSGSGKTTMVNMVPKFHLPESGSIRLNGRDLSEYTLASLRRAMGMVSQDAFLFNTTIAENIAYGQPSMEMDDIAKAAEAAYAHEFISKLPLAYETIVGERGVKLSGGQKQRLTIARALLKNPALLILDEATSALDTQSERIVQLALENLMKERTSIVIAHRLSTVLSADRILVMEAGRVIAEGPHAELLVSCPLYAELYRMQFSDESRAPAPRAAEDAPSEAV